MTAISISPPDAATTGRLANFPVSFFSMVMGLAGLTIATQKLEAAAGLGAIASDYLFWGSAAVYVAIALVYLIKLTIRSKAVAAEWAHPVRIAFFPAMSIALILLSIAALHFDRTLSFWLWSVGAALHFVYTVMVITAWINHSRYEVVHLNPAWFIPVVGNVLVPIVGVQHAPADVSWLYVSIGLLFWLVLLTVVVNRLIFHHPLPARMMPTLFILIAPPAVGFIAWTNLVGTIDPAARVMFFAALFFFVLMIPQLGKFARIPFALSWWAYSFPLAALTIAQFVMADRSGIEFYRYIGYGLYALLALVISGLLIRTLIALVRGEICVAEH